MFTKHVQSFSRVLCWSLHIFDASTYKYQFYTNPIQIEPNTNRRFVLGSICKKLLNARTKPIQIEDL